MDSASWTKVPQLLALSSARDDIDLKAPGYESGYSTDRRSHARNYFKSAQWYDPRRQTIDTRFMHSWLAGLLMARLSSPTRPIIVLEPSYCACLSTRSGCSLIEPKGRPPDLLQDRDQELSLHPYAEVHCVEAVKALSTFPLFDLQDTSTTLLLCSVPDHPLRLHSALSGELVASYPFINVTTEAYIAPHSLLFTCDGRSFIAGSSNLIAMFDVSRPGDGPVSLFRTASSRKASKHNSSFGLKGIVSALSVEPASNILAAGTFSRHVGLYNAAGQGDCLGVFRVDGNEADGRIGGRGITQLLWSPCGRYLYIVERNSGGVMVYDIRKSGQLLSWAEGRKAETNQRLAIDLSHSSTADGGIDIWAGGIDGTIRVWNNTHLCEGPRQPDLGWYAHDGRQWRCDATKLDYD
jgi:telomerase Cajal body protein 1